VRNLARNPALPASLLPRVLANPAGGRYSVMAQRQWTDELFDAVAAHPDPRVREELAQTPAATAQQRARMVTDSSVNVLAALIEGPWARHREPLPEHAYRTLAQHPRPIVRLLVAECRLAPRDLLEALTEDPQDYVASAARSTLSPPKRETARPINRQVAEATLSSGAGWERARVALAPGLPADLIERLTTDPDPVVRQSVSMRPELSEEQRAAIDYHVSTEDRLPVLDWVARADGDELNRCVSSAHIGLRRSAACNPRLNASQIAALCADDDFAVRLLLCERQTDVPAELVVRTYLEARVITREELLRHPALKEADLTRYADSPHWEARAIVVLDRHAPAELIERLSHDEDDSVRCWMAHDDRLPLTRVIELFDDPATSAAASANPRLPVELMEKILDEADNLQGPPAGAAVVLGVKSPSHEPLPEI
jgi:hypothetical protein